jgi:hypothetical protein
MFDYFWICTITYVQTSLGVLFYHVQAIFTIEASSVDDSKTASGGCYILGSMHIIFNQYS